MAALEIQLFGGLALLHDGQPLTRLPSRRGKDLFAYLLLNRAQFHPREQLAGLFWGESGDQKARHCLNTTLWRLNNVLGRLRSGHTPYLKIDQQRIGFNTASDFMLDVAEFETRCAWAEQLGPEAADQQAFLLRQAITFYRADLLVDCYEEWCLIERERLQQRYLRSLKQLLTYHAARDEDDAAIDCARRILVCEPMSEETHRELIAIYLAIGQQSAALRQYRECEEILRRELAVAPMPETQALLVRLLDSVELPRGRAVRVQPGPQHPLPPAAPGTLADILVRLEAASAHFDRAHEQLHEATAMLQRSIRRQEPALIGGPDGQTPGAAELQQVLGLVTDLTRRMVPALSSGAPL